MNKAIPVTSQTNTKVVIFSHNRKDTAFRKRIDMLQKAGATVSSFSFRRDGQPAHPGPEWTNIDLGHLDHARFIKRIASFFRALLRIVRNRQLIADADIIHARNLDIFLLAWFARTVCQFGSSSARSKLIYECLDVHEALTRDSLQASLLRRLERTVLRHSDLLVISSPGFISHYFEPQQLFNGRHHWVENKLFLNDQIVDRPTDIAPLSGPLVIVWVGILRCEKTLALLKATARAMPNDVIIRISGLVSYFLIPDFDEQIAEIDNIEFTGTYEWPHGLRSCYAGAHLVWSQELSWSGHNSDWLIPNRVYEASYFGVPSIAVKTTETGRYIDERGLGYALPDAEHAPFIEFLKSLDKKELAERQNALLLKPASEFVSDQSDADDLLDAMLMTTDGVVIAQS